MIDFHDLTPSEQTFLTTAQTGEDGGYSEFLLEVNEWSKPLALHVNDYEVSVLDDDLDPWEYLAENRYIDVDDAGYLAAEDRLDEYEIPKAVLEEVDLDEIDKEPETDEAVVEHADRERADVETEYHERDVSETVEASQGATAAADEGAEEPHEEAVEEPHEKVAEDLRAEAAEDRGDDLSTISGVGETYAGYLADAGVETVGELAVADIGSLSEETSIPLTLLDEWADAASTMCEPETASGDAFSTTEVTTDADD